MVIARAAAGLMVTVAVADFVASAVDVAFTVAVVWLATDAGAVYKPEVDSVPTPVSAQATAVLAEPVTVAVNCWVLPPFSVADSGEILTATGLIVTVAEADFVESACDLAFTVTIV